MKKIDYKKDFKDLYFPKNEPMVIDVPEMIFFMVDGAGNPNTADEYKNALSVLYGLTYTIKMSHLGKEKIDGYVDYTVFPLEGLWWSDTELFINNTVSNKDNFKWTSMIRQPDFVTEDVFKWALDKMKVKNPDLDYSGVYYKKFTEGLCAQIMHFGVYDDEGPTIDKLDKFIIENGYDFDINDERKHHEIYLGDPRKAKPENLKTVLRHPIKKK